MFLALALACVHRVEVTTFPEGATVRYGRAGSAVAPATLDVYPFGRRRFTVSLPGYRTVTMRVPPGTSHTAFVGDALTFRWARALGRRPYAVLEVRLVADHDGVGTWAPEDVTGLRRP